MQSAFGAVRSVNVLPFEGSPAACRKQNVDRDVGPRPGRRMRTAAIAMALLAAATADAGRSIPLTSKAVRGQNGRSVSRTGNCPGNPDRHTGVLWNLPWNPGRSVLRVP